MSEVVLYDFWRSSACYRVRIVLNLKGVAYRAEQVDLAAGEQRGEAFRAHNPLGLVPLLTIDGHELAQSLAIIDYLDANFEQPRMVSADPAQRARTLAQALTIASEVHPLQNLRVLNYLRQEMGQGEQAVLAWLHRWMGEGLAALEAQAPADGLFGEETPNLADICLVPQFYSARRFDLPLAPYPRLAGIEARLREMPAITAAAPEAVRPAPAPGG